MNQLVDGKWLREPFRPKLSGGAFNRPDSQFRDWIATAPGSRFRPEPGRYHLYVSLACPWAHRTLIFRALKGLQECIDVTVVHPHMGERGWSFDSSFPGAEGDPLHGFSYLYELYAKARADYSGIITVPVLWDRAQETIVNNESAEIIRMLNSAFDACGANALDFYPEALRGAIDALNAQIYACINNGVYRAGFATDQGRYEEAVCALFGTLDDLERRLARQRYLVGERITEADWRLFTTLVRFDTVYYLHFKCNLRRLVDYPHLWAYTRDLYQQPGIAATVDFAHIKHHYYTSHSTLNPGAIVPLGPRLDFTTVHGGG
jgi:putative glutathione S-transferase